MPGTVRQFVVFALVALLTAGLAACGARPTSAVLQPVERAPLYTPKVRLLVATTRGHGSTDDPEAYTAARAKTLNYAALTVSIPTHHKPGSVEWPDQTPADPAYHFITTDRQVYEQADFVNEIRAQARRGGTEAGDVLVFVHGYNTLYEESVYRFAQVVHDSGFQGTAVLFAWPSRGSAPLYLADREASTYSRDYFEQMLMQISAIPEVKEVNILAHSMGTWLTVETLRQAKMKGHVSFNGKLGDVVLAAPDLDVTVFRTQLDVIGALPRPMTVLISGDDKVLALSTFLAGGVERAGHLSGDDARVIAGAKKYNLRVVDLSRVDGGEGSNHSKVFKSAAVVAAVGDGLRREAEGKSVPGGGVVSAVTDVGTSLLSVPVAIIGAAAQ